MDRKQYIKEISLYFKTHPICAILGPRQVGKTTLAHRYIEQHRANTKIQFFDLENPLHLAQLENAMLVLSNLPVDLIVIDEIQRRPELFPMLRVIVDEQPQKQFLILGSASRELIKQSSESLAGRIAYLELTPFSLYETHTIEPLLIRGGFPRSYLANSDSESMQWRQQYITNFLEQDIPNLGFNIPAQHMRRFWQMLAHYHGQTFNASQLSKSLEISDTTVRRYVDILTGTFMIRTLQPWIENIEKRQVKAPKIYFRDSGILNTLIGINSITELLMNPRLGSLWEGFALEEVIRVLQINPFDCYFWGTHAQAELDLFMQYEGKRIGFEIKYTQSPKTTKSMHIAYEDLKLDHLGVIYPGADIFPLSKQMTAYGLESIAKGTFVKQVRKAIGKD